MFFNQTECFLLSFGQDCCCAVSNISCSSVIKTASCLLGIFLRNIFKQNMIKAAAITDINMPGLPSATDPKTITAKKMQPNNGILERL